MADIGKTYATWAPRLLSVLRIVVGFLFMLNGTQKLLGFPAAMQGGTVSPLAFPLGIAGTLELVGGLLIMLGLFTRPVAFILAGQMAVAYFMQHAPSGFWPRSNNGERAVLYCFIFLYLSAAGGGAWSLDRLLRRTRV